MGRNGSVGKDSALEALYQVQKRRGWKERPRPSQPNFSSVITAIDLWKGKSYWAINKLSSSPRKKTRDALLHTVSAWLNRRKKRGGPSKFVEAGLAKRFEEEIMQAGDAEIAGAKCNSATCSAGGKPRCSAKKESSVPTSKPSEKKYLNATQCPVLHTCPEAGVHVDFMVDGTLECKHRATSRKCCYDSQDHVHVGNLAMLDSSEWEQWGELVQGLTNHGGLAVQEGEHKQGHKHAQSCGHRAVLHKCPEEGPHLDFIVDGEIQCRHRSNSLTCCDDTHVVVENMNEIEQTEWDNLIKLLGE